MIVALIVLTTLLAVVLALVSFVQTLYLESLRLRSRDLPALELFKGQIEDQLGMKTEDGALCFSLLKHSLILFLGICLFGAMVSERAPSIAVTVEAAAGAWLAMLTSAYLLPQALYRRTTGRWLLPLVPLVKVLALASKPVTAPMQLIQSVLAGEPEKPRQEEAASEAVEALIEVGAEEGLIEEEDRKLLQSVVEFGDKTVRQVLTPRPNIVAIQATASLDDLRQLVIHEQFSRIPVYEASIDDIVGYVHVRDMFEMDEDSRKEKMVRELVRKIRFVPESKPVNDLLREMQETNTHMVIVVDEYGNTAGLASMEDLVEVIVGEIRDEHEPSTDIAEEGEDTFVVSGSFDVSRLNELFDVRLPEDTESTTVGGLASEWLGHVPEPGESAERVGIRIEVLASNGLRVEQVRLTRAKAMRQDGNHAA